MDYDPLWFNRNHYDKEEERIRSYCFGDDRNYIVQSNVCGQSKIYDFVCPVFIMSSMIFMQEYEKYLTIKFTGKLREANQSHE